jgi:hypothetical protein
MHHYENPPAMGIMNERRLQLSIEEHAGLNETREQTWQNIFTVGTEEAVALLLSRVTAACGVNHKILVSQYSVQVRVCKRSFS